MTRKAKPGYKLELSNFKKYEEIPDDWSLRTLDKVGKIVGGGTPKTTVPEYWNGNILWATPSDLTEIESNYIDDTERKITQKGLDESSATPIDAGNIIFSSRATVGECKINTKSITTNQGFQNIIPKDQHDKMFVFYAVQQNKIKFIRIAYGTTFLEISKNNLKKIKIPFPKTLDEEQKIGVILSNIDELIQSYNKTVKTIKKLKQGLMQQLVTRGIGHKKFKKVKWLFDKEIEIPEEWEITTFNDSFTFLTSGTNSRSDLVTSGNFNYIHYGDIHTKWNSILDCQKETIPFIDKSKVENLSLLQDGDLIIADASEDYEGSGDSILISNINKKKIVSGLHTIALRAKTNQLYPNFLRYLNSIKSVKIQIISKVTGTSVYGLSKNNLKKIKIPLPTLEEQKKISLILYSVDDKISDLESKKKSLESL